MNSKKLDYALRIAGAAIFIELLVLGYVLYEKYHEINELNESSKRLIEVIQEEGYLEICLAEHTDAEWLEFGRILEAGFEDMNEVIPNVYRQNSTGDCDVYIDRDDLGDDWDTNGYAEPRNMTAYVSEHVLQMAIRDRHMPKLHCLPGVIVHEIGHLVLGNLDGYEFQDPENLAHSTRTGDDVMAWNPFCPTEFSPEETEYIEGRLGLD